MSYDTDEIVPLTEEAIHALLESRRGVARAGELGRRTSQRWAFPSAVEIWLPTEGGGQRHILGVCHDLTAHGVGVRCEEPLPVGSMLPIAVHQPEASFHGRALVRHCTVRGSGFLVGFEFIFHRP